MLTCGKDGSMAEYSTSAEVCSTCPSGFDRGFMAISSSSWKRKEGVKLTKSGFFGGEDLKKIENESYKTMSLK